MTAFDESKRYECAAHGCPMTGAAFPGGTSSKGTCCYHLSANPSDWGRITRALTDWAAISAEINACRRVMTNPNTAIDLKVQDERFAEAWLRVRHAVLGSAWQDDLAPRPRERYGEWGKRLETFLNARLLADINAHATRRPA